MILLLRLVCAARLLGRFLRRLPLLRVPLLQLLGLLLVLPLHGRVRLLVRVLLLREAGVILGLLALERCAFLLLSRLQLRLLACGGLLSSGGGRRRGRGGWRRLGQFTGMDRGGQGAQ